MILTIPIYENEMLPFILDLVSYIILSIKILHILLYLLIPPCTLDFIVNGMFLKIKHFGHTKKYTETPLDLSSSSINSLAFCDI